MKSATPYHAGEIAAQNKAGTRGAAAELAAVMTDSLNFSSNHDEFLAARKFSVLTSVDSVSGDVWVHNQVSDAMRIFFIKDIAFEPFANTVDIDLGNFRTHAP